MTRSANKVAVLAKIETTYGTDATPTALANAVLASGPEVTPIEGDTVSREIVKPYFGASPQLLVGKYVSCKFAVELAGSGTPGAVPGMGVLLRACAMAETITPGNQVDYNPVSEALESATIYYFLDGTLHKLTGARGTFSLSYETAAIPKIEFTFQGQYSAPAAAAMPTPDYSGFQQPLPAGEGNTSSFTLHGLPAATACPSSISIELGNSVTSYQTLCKHQHLITNREATATVNLEAPAIGDHDFFADSVSGATGVLAWQHGVQAGHIVELAAPAAEIGQLGYSDQDGALTHEIPLRLLPDSGNDELILTFR